MNNYKLIALDMDGTLLTTWEDILQETIADIKSAVERGKTVVLCTGRGIPELKDYRELLSFVRYAIMLSGAQIYDFWENRCLLLQGIPQAVSLKIIRVVESYVAMAHFYTESELIVDKTQLERVNTYHISGYDDFLRQHIKVVENVKAEILLHKIFPKIDIFFQTRRDRQIAFEQLTCLPLTISRADDLVLELSPKYVTKGSGLQFLARYLQIPVEDTIAIGDSDNDRSVLRTAGLSVAMGNAEADILLLADCITSDNDHNGVGEAIRKYLL